MAATESLSAFAGPTGVGALCFLGVFLFLDGRAPSLFPAVEAYAKTSTWSVIAAVPVLAMAYLTGLVLISGASAGVRVSFGPSVEQEAKDTLVVSSKPAKESVLAQRYIQFLQERDCLAGAAFSLVVLAAGLLSEKRTLAEANAIESWLVITAAAIAVLASVALYAAAGVRAREAHTFAAVSERAAAPSLNATPAVTAP